MTDSVILERGEVRSNASGVNPNLIAANAPQPGTRREMRDHGEQDQSRDQECHPEMLDPAPESCKWRLNGPSVAPSGCAAALAEGGLGFLLGWWLRSWFAALTSIVLASPLWHSVACCV